MAQPNGFLEKLVNLHLAYQDIEPQLQQFKQLVSLSPAIVQSLANKFKKDSDIKNEIFVSYLYASMKNAVKINH